MDEFEQKRPGRIKKEEERSFPSNELLGLIGSKKKEARGS